MCHYQIPNVEVGINAFPGHMLIWRYQDTLYMSTINEGLMQAHQNPPYICLLDSGMLYTVLMYDHHINKPCLQQSLAEIRQIA